MFKETQRRWKGGEDLPISHPKPHQINILTRLSLPSPVVYTSSPDWYDSCPDLVDFSSHNRHKNNHPRISSEASSSSSYGPSYAGPSYTLPDYPGFIYCPSALSHSLISTLSHLCLSSYCEPPHETNITLLPLKPNEIISDDNTSMFQKYVKGLDVSREYRNFGKLSWATCGYNYDWSLRKYHEDRKSPFPRGTNKDMERARRNANWGPPYFPCRRIYR